jgi:adenosylcobinamide amidohydrolase
MKAPSIHLSGKALAVRFRTEQAILSWSLTRPGFARADAVAWLQVTDADLGVDVDPVVLLRERLAAAGYADAVQMMTSRDVRKHHQAHFASGQANAFCLATVGLANSGRVGDRSFSTARTGTINLLVQVDRPLDEAGLLEALSIATEARTAAVMDLDWRRHGKVVTGTGTDCIAVACPVSDRRETYAGLHTDIGAAIGGVVYAAVQAGGLEWIAEKTGAAEAGEKTG